MPMYQCIINKESRPPAPWFEVDVLNYNDL